MNVLLDTNAFLRWVEDDSLLSEQARWAISKRGHTVYVSAVVAWEIAIKSGSGKLKLALPVERYVAGHIETNGFLWLPIELRDIACVETLPLHHRDPFDRLLISQAITRKLTIITSDTAFPRYGIPTIS